MEGTHRLVFLMMVLSMSQPSFGKPNMFTRFLGSKRELSTDQIVKLMIPGFGHEQLLVEYGVQGCKQKEKVVAVFDPNRLVSHAVTARLGLNNALKGKSRLSNANIQHGDLIMPIARDYTHQPFTDRGHLLAENYAASQNQKDALNMMFNIVPQDATFNRYGQWRVSERIMKKKIKDCVDNGGTPYMTSGSIPANVCRDPGWHTKLRVPQKFKSKILNRDFIEIETPAFMYSTMWCVYPGNSGKKMQHFSFVGPNQPDSVVLVPTKFDDFNYFVTYLSGAARPLWRERLNLESMATETKDLEDFKLGNVTDVLRTPDDENFKYSIWYSILFYTKAHAEYLKNSGIVLELDTAEEIQFVEKLLSLYDENAESQNIRNVMVVFLEIIINVSPISQSMDMKEMTKHMKEVSSAMKQIAMMQKMIKDMKKMTITQHKDKKLEEGGQKGEQEGVGRRSG